MSSRGRSRNWPNSSFQSRAVGSWSAVVADVRRYAAWVRNGSATCCGARTSHGAAGIVCETASEATRSDWLRSPRDALATRAARPRRNEGEMSARSSNSDWYGPECTPLGRTARGEGSKFELVDLEIQNPLAAPVIVYCSDSRVETVR